MIINKILIKGSKKLPTRIIWATYCIYFIIINLANVILLELIFIATKYYMEWSSKQDGRGECAVTSFISYKCKGQRKREDFPWWVFLNII